MVAFLSRDAQQFILLIFAAIFLVACKTTESTGLQDYSNGINVAVAASATNPAYLITDKVGVAGSGYAYLLEKTSGRWRMTYDSFDAKAFVKRVGKNTEVPTENEVLWTDGHRVAVYFGSASLSFSKVDGSFACPKNKDVPAHRACRSQFTESKNLFGGFNNESNLRAFVLDVEEIKQAVMDTGVVAIAKKRLRKY